MSIRKKILFYFSWVSILLVAGLFVFIYTLFSQYREQEFQQRQKEKITNTLRFLTDVKKLDDDLIQSIDRVDINGLYDEKLLIFDRNKNLIYSSIDDTPIQFSNKILSDLSETKPWFEQKDGLYDVIGISLTSNEKAYYGISKAYDTFGYTKLNFLRNILLITFIAFSIIIILISFYLSKKITQPIVNITKKINSYNFETTYSPIEFEESKNEIAILARQFNMLMKKMNEVFSFQKHAIHHISHELKTPVAILVSNFERLEKETDMDKLKAAIRIQKEETKSLSEVINSLLEIAKAESDFPLIQKNIRVDELIFDVADELNSLHPDFRFLVEYTTTENENNLMVSANIPLLKAAISNLMINCIKYSPESSAKIVLSNQANLLNINFENRGPVITEDEKQFLFQHFFRGESSKGKKGFGLGLVLIHKIMQLHGGNITYTSLDDTINIFSISLPISQNVHPEV